MSSWRPPLWYDRLASIAWRAIVVVAAVAMVISGIVGLSSVILPVALGLLFACGLHPVWSWLVRQRIPPAAAAGITVLALLAAVAVVAWLTVRLVVDQWGEIVALIDSARQALVDTAIDHGMSPSTAASLDGDVDGLVTRITGMLFEGLVHVLPAVVGIVGTVLLSFLVAFFFLKDGSSMWRWILVRLGESAELTDRIGDRVWTALTGFIIGQTVIAAVDATLITLGAIVLGVPEPGAVFMLTFFGAYIPFIGAFLSGLVAVMLAIGDDGLAQGVAMLAVVVVVQVLEGNVLQPWIQGRAVRLHPLVIALSVTAGGALAGFLGIFLAVPITAAGFVALSELRQAGIIGPLPTSPAEEPVGDAAPDP